MTMAIRKAVSYLLAVTLLVTCTLSGIVLPATAETTNLLTNGDLELGASVAWGNTPYVMDGVGVGGSKGIKIETTVNEGDSAVWPGPYYKDVFNGMLEPNTTYIFSFDYKHEGKGFAKFDITRGGTDWVGWEDINLPNVSEWTTRTFEFTTGEAGNMNANKGWEWAPAHIHYANAESYGTGAAYYDNFKLEKKPANATGIVLSATSMEVTIGTSKTLTVSAKPDGVATPSVTWTSANEAVATVEGGKVTGVSLGTTTITASADGLAPVTCAVTVTELPPLGMPNGTFDASESGWTYDSTVSDKFSKNDPVPTQAEANGNKYIQIPANGAIIKSPLIACDLKSGDWVQANFKVRKTAAGKMRFALRWQAGMFTGYAQPDWLIAYNDTDTSGNGEWFTFTAYARVKTDTKTFRLSFLEISGNTTADLTLDLDDIEVQKLDAKSEYELNLLYNGAMDAPTAELNDTGYNGLFADGGKIEADPADATNKVLHLTSNAQAYFSPNVYSVESETGTSKENIRYRKETVYKFTYRQKGTGTTAPNMTSNFATVLSTDGAPNKASEEWKTVTVYFRTTTSLNANYTFDFKTYGDVYLDDFSLYAMKPVTSITLDKASHEMEIGETVTLTATTAPAEAYTETLKWTSDNTAVATVKDGVVTAVGSGTAIITVTCGTVSATCTIKTGEPQPATSIELDKTAVSLKVGDTATLTATTKPVGAPAEPIVWSVDNSSVATVKDGVITAVSAGTAVVTVTSGTLTATCTVTVARMADALHIPMGNVEIVPNGTIQLTATAVPEASDIGTLTWASSDTAVVTVDQSGKVTAVAAQGAATVTVTNNEGKSASVTVTINAYANLLSNGDLELGNAGIFDHLPCEGVSVEDGVGIDGSKAVVLSKDYQNAVAYFHNMNKVKLQPNSRYILSLWAKGPAITLSCSTYTDITFADGKKQWYTSATTDEWKELRVVIDTGAAPDLNNSWSFYLKQTAKNVEASTYVDNITLKRQPDAESISITPAQIELLPDDTASLIINSFPANTNIGAVTWSSSNESIVSVSQSGMITAMTHEGTATITATTSKGFTATCTVTINQYGNLLKNADFEQGGLCWSETTQENVKPGIGKDGSYGLQLVNPIPDRVQSYFYKLELPVLPATTYEISFDYLATPDCSIRVWSGTMNLTSPSVKKGDGTQWQHASGTFTTPADMTLNKGWDISIVSDSEGKTPAVVDNVCLRLYTSGVAAESITLNRSETIIVPGRTETLAIIATPTNGDTNRSTWTSSNEDVATVDNGLVTAIGKGTAIITAKTTNGKTASCTVTVSGEEALIINGTFDKENDTSWQLSGGAALDADKGRMNSTGAVLTKNAAVSQKITGLQAKTTYILSFRYRSTNGSVIAKITNGDAVLIEKTAETVGNWAKANYEFTTPETVTGDSLLTLTTTGNGPIYLDNVFLVKKASLIDLVVKDIVWDGGDEQVLTGTKLVFAATIANEGTDPVPAGSVIEIDVSVDRQVVRTFTYTCTENMESGDFAIVMDTVSWEATKGAHVVSARVNPRLSLLEMNTVNNARQIHLRVEDDAILEAPEMALKAGMDKLIFSDEFDSIDTIDTAATGDEGYNWYVTRQWSAPTVTRDAYDVKDGILTIHNPVPTYGITLTSVDVNTHNGFSWNKGYLEVRLCIPTPRDTYGGSVTVWSFPTSKWYETPGENDAWVEMDWLEFWGNTDKHPDGYWTVTLHDEIKDMETGESTFWASNSNSTINALGDKQWHTIGWLWDENLIQVYLDGVKVFNLTYDPEGLPDPYALVKNGVLHQGIFSLMNTQEMCLFLSGDVDVPLLVDYVHIWQGEGGGMSTDEEEEETPEEFIDISAEDFWYNFCTDDWGDPIAEVTEENYQNILGGQEYWPLLSAQRREEINALLAEYGMPSYDELLADALIIADGGTLEDNPSTGESARALPAVACAAVLSTAVLWTARKRRKEK